MAIRYYLSVTVLFLVLWGNAHAQSLSSSLGWTGFVEGVSRVPSVLSVTDVPSGTVGVSFYIDSYNTSIPLENLKIDYAGGDGWAKLFDMGRVRPGATLSVAFLSLTGDTLGDVLTQPISTTPRPVWLESTRLSNVQVVGRQVQMNASYPINAILNSHVPAEVTALGNRRFSLFDGSADLSISYDLDSRRSSVTSPFISVGINVFNQKVAHRKFAVPVEGIELDENFNLRYKTGDSSDISLFALDIPTIYIPIVSFVDLEFDAGVRLDARLKAQMIVGNEGSDWGFVRDGDQTTGLSATVYGSGYMRGGIRVLFGAVSVRGTLAIRGLLGGGIHYVSVPQESLTTTFGGGLEVSGELRAKALFWTVAKIGPKRLYQTSFGTLPGGTIHSEDHPFLKASTTAIDEAYAVPEHAPQPSMAAAGDHVGIGWVERRGDDATIWFSAISSGDAAFGSPLTVTRTQHSPGSPSLSMMTDGSALLSWTESRYTAQTVPDSANILQLLKSQDVWIAAFNASSRMIGAPVRMTDDITGVATGCPEAEPRICALDANNGVAVWMALNEANNGSDLWYSAISRNGANVTATAPAKLPTPGGANRNPIATRLDGTRMMLVWINEQNSGGTSEARLISATWNGSDWSSPVTIATSQQGEAFDEPTMAISGARGILAWSNSMIDTNGRIEQRVSTRYWDGASGLWTADNSFSQTDTTAWFTSPRVSIGAEGRAVLSYQVVPRAPDSLDRNQGTRHLAIRDLTQPSGAWTQILGLEMISDTSMFVWEAQTAFAGEETLYVLTEEHGSSAPTNSVSVGDPVLGLRLRAVRLAQDMTFQDITEPIGPVSGLPAADDATRLKLEIEPGQTAGEFVLSYRVAKPSPVVIEMFDVMGERVGAILDAALETGSYRTMVTLDGVPAGMYFLRLTDGANQTVVPVRFTP